MRSNHVRSRRDGEFFGAGLTAYVALALALRETGLPRRRERRLFRLLNSERVSGPVPLVAQQLGTPWTLPALAVVARLFGRRRLAWASALALPVEKLTEVATKELSKRPRPAQVMPALRLRDDAPTEGSSYPSGHAAISACAVALAAPHLPGPVSALLAGASTLTAYRRVEQGAHFPTDSLGGICLGLSVASGLRLLVGYDPI
ncbi:MAG: phosphatase PAP2 family protein [Actinomycetota bacterium]|nr:phosphatase PAP2 family protein [Actinomycetota bacterium]